ncbi:hypothetical protein QQ045_030753 [Rhodiola kirilowii]
MVLVLGCSFVLALCWSALVVSLSSPELVCQGGWLCGLSVSALALVVRVKYLLLIFSVLQRNWVSPAISVRDMIEEADRDRDGEVNGRGVHEEDFD